MKKIVLLLTVILGFCLTARTQAIIDDGPTIRIGFSYEDTVSVVKDNIGEVDTNGGNVLIYSKTGKILHRLDYSVFGFSDVHALRRRIEGLLGAKPFRAYVYDASGVGPDTVFTIVDTDTVSIDVMT